MDARNELNFLFEIDLFFHRPHRSLRSFNSQHPDEFQLSEIMQKW